MTDRSAESYGERPLTWVDRFGVWLSQRAVRRRLPPGGNLNILELGCGYRAAQLAALRDRIGRATGVDFRISPAARRLPGFEFHEGAAEDVLPRLPENSFDAILLISVLEHLRDPGAILEMACRRLRPGGVLLVNVPTWRGKAFLEFSAFRLGLSPRVEMDDHKMYYDKRDLWPLLVRAGFPPSEIRMRRHKFGLNLFASAIRPVHGDDWDSHWERYASAVSRNPAQEMRHRVVERILKRTGVTDASERRPYPARRILDIGSGQGDLMVRLAREFPEAELAGFELSASGVEQSRRKVPGARFVVADLFRPPPEAAAFQDWATDAVCSEVLEHVDDPVAFLRAARAYLAPGARLIVTVPSGPMSAFDRHIGHRRHFNRETAGRCLSEAGFAVERIDRAGFPFFNLYRSVVIARGRRLLADADEKGGGASARLADAVMAAFRVLLRSSLPDFPFGWQIVAVARKRAEP